MTISEIARLAGVSRGTVDRVLHKRGKVRPEVAERVEKLIASYHYAPNPAAMMLKRSEKPLTFGVLLPPLENAFYYDIIAGIEQAEAHYAQYRVTVRVFHLQALTPACQIQAIETLLKEGIDGLILIAIGAPEMTLYMKQLPKQLPIVTYNTDFTSVERLCFVGQEHVSAGRTAGELICKMHRGEGKLMPLVSYNNILSHTQRVEGLCQALRERNSPLTVLPAMETEESDNTAYRIVSHLLKADPKVACIYVAGGGQVGASNALADSGRENEVMMVCHDLLPQTIEHLKQGVVDFTIGQQPELQGYMPVRILYEYLTLGRLPEQEHYYTSIDVLLQGNADFCGNSFRTIHSTNV